MQVFSLSMLVAFGALVDALPGAVPPAWKRSASATTAAISAVPSGTSINTAGNNTVAATRVAVASGPAAQATNNEAPAHVVPSAVPSAPYVYNNNKMEVSMDSWKSYDVNSWLQSYYDSHYSSHGEMSLSSFWGQYYNNPPSCSMGQSCDMLSWAYSSSYNYEHFSMQAYHVMYSYQNIHDMFSYIYNTYLSDDVMTWSQIAEIAVSFHSQDSSYSYSHYNYMDMYSTFWGAWSHYLNSLGNNDPNWLESSGYLQGHYGILSIVSKNAWNSMSVPLGQHYGMDQQSTEQFYHMYVMEMRNCLQNLYSSIFDHGENIQDVMWNGGWCDRHALNLDCSSCVSESQNWMMTYMATKMVNYMWMDDNVFISYMPYGQVIQQESVEVLSDSYQPTYSNFGYNDCLEQQKNAPQYTHCYEPSSSFSWNGWGPGMARLVWYSPQYSSGYSSWSEGNIGHVDLTHAPYGWDGSSYNSAFGDKYKSTWNWNTIDIITSSVGGFDEGGYNYDGLASMSMEMTKTYGGYGSSYESDYNNLYHSMSQMWNYSPSSSGWWSLPVCIINDWNAWPTVYGVESSHQVGYSLCQCMNSKDRYGKAFPAAVGSELSWLSTHYGYSGNSWNMCGESYGHSRYVPGPSH